MFFAVAVVEGVVRVEAGEEVEECKPASEEYRLFTCTELAAV